MQTKWQIRKLALGFAALVCLGVGAASLAAQSSPPPPPNPDENPFPGAPEKPASDAQQPGQKPAAGSAADGTRQPRPDSDNPFPGDLPGSPANPGDAGSAARHDPDGDPVRSPDDAGPASSSSDDGFSSSRSGLNHLPVEDDNDARPGKSTKVKTRQQVLKEDLDVGEFYMEKKNWKAAQGRYAAAFALDPENADAVWGLAESERHLDLFKDAAEHYKLFLSYDPDGPHGKAARKALEQVESAKPAHATVNGNGGFDNTPHQ